jgi:mono/diheme cytochrome c family protein
MSVGCGRHARDEEFDTSQARIPRDSATITAAIDSGIVTPAEIAQGDSVFNGRGNVAGMCAPCHGQNGVGTGAAPSLADTVWIHGDGSIGFIKGTIYQGVPHPREHPLPMPPLGASLTERQVQAVAAYVFALSRATKR